MILSAPPWDMGFTPLSRSRILVLANSDVNWSRTVCEEYCSARGIPGANIVDVSLGTNATIWYPGGGTSTDNSAIQTFVDNLVTEVERISAQGVLLGPGTPYKVAVAGTSDSAGTSYNAGTVGYPPLSQLVAGCQGYTFTGTMCAQNLGSEAYRWGDWRDTFTGITYPDNLNLALGLGATTVTESASLGSGLLSITVPMSSYTAYLGAAGSRDIAVGRIGYGSYEVNELPAAETQANVEAIIRSVPSPYTREQALRNPVLFQLEDVGGSTSHENYALLMNYAKGWGVNTKYFYRTTPSSGAAAVAPASGASYTLAQLDAGSVVGDEYYLMVGCGVNTTEMYETPYVDAWTPKKGGGVLMGPSDGYKYGLQSLQDGGLCSLSNSTHISEGYAQRQLNVFHNLVRGMSWLEACFYAQIYSRCVPSGDPLWAPYGNPVGRLGRFQKRRGFRRFNFVKG